MNSESPVHKPDEPEKENSSGPGANQILTHHVSISGADKPALPSELAFAKALAEHIPCRASRETRVPFLLGIPQSEAWNQALRQIQAGYFKGRRFEHALTTVTPSIHKPIFGAISMILYDNQLRQTRPITNALTGQPFCAVKSKDEADDYLRGVHNRLRFIAGTGLNLDDLGKSVLEHILYVDYSMRPPSLQSKSAWSLFSPFWLLICSAVSDYSVCCAYTTPPKALTELLARHLQFLPRLSPSLSFWTAGKYEYDLVLMLHHYWTHLKKSSVPHFWHGATGYAGIMNELIAEVPIVGNERLGRKLSVDFHENIEKFVRSEGDRKIMIKKAEDIATEFGIVLSVKNTNGLGTPTFETYYKNGLPRNT